MPPDLKTGAYQLIDLADTPSASLYEGKVVTDKKFGHATYGCMICCGYNALQLNPSPVDSVLYGSAALDAEGMDACGGRTLLNLDGYADPSSWMSDNTSVMTVAPRQVTGVSIGSANTYTTLTNIMEGKTYSGEGNPCPLYDETLGGEGNVLPPVPNNFRVTGSVDRGNGDLHIVVAWGSTSGDTDDLTACQVGETVTYQGANPYPLPSPPFPAITFQNPTEASTAATDFTGTDEHDFGDPAEPPPQFVKPYSSTSFTGKQTYWYSCSNVNNGTRVILWGPNTVTRSVSSNGSGGWKFTVSETNVPNSATINPLP